MITACGFVTDQFDHFWHWSRMVATVITACGFVTETVIDDINLVVFWLQQ